MMATSTTPITHIALTVLVADPDYQPREKLDASNLSRLEASDPTQWPPLIVSPRDDGRYTILDGFHRYAVARKLSIDGLDCSIKEGGDYPDSVEANLTHGLPLSRNDRKEYARWLHEQHPKLSPRELGRMCGLSHNTVRAALDSNGVQSEHQRKAAPNHAARLVKSLLDVRNDAANAWGIKSHGARVEAFKGAIAGQTDPKQAADQLADTCRAALEAAEAITRKAKK